MRRLLTRLATLLAVLALPAAVSAQGKITIKIATQSPLSGPAAALGEGIKLGAQLAIEKLRGPIEKLGFRVELVPFDDQARPHRGVANAKNIISDRDILAVIGHLNSGVAIPSSEVYKDVTLAMISPASTDPLITDRGLPNVNRVCGRDDVQGAVGAEYAAGTLKVRNVYVIHDKTTYGQGMGELFKADAERRGLKIVGFEGTGEPSNVDAIIGSIKTKSVDLIYFGGLYDQAGPFFKQAREKGVKARFLGAGGPEMSDRTKSTGKGVVGMQYISAVSPVSLLPKARPFAEDFQRRFGKGPAPYAAEAYDAAVIVLRAIEAAARGGKAPSREDVSAAIRKLKHEGITGDIEFDTKGDRKRAPYFVLEVASEDSEKGGESKVVKQLTIGPPAKN